MYLFPTENLLSTVDAQKFKGIFSTGEISALNMEHKEKKYWQKIDKVLRTILFLCQGLMFLTNLIHL